jgi:RHS repeat-associated protein
VVYLFPSNEKCKIKNQATLYQKLCYLNYKMYLTQLHFYISKNYLYSKPLVGLLGCGQSYRFAFNGMERDDEVKGSGNSYDFGARMYDSRLGRWLSLDPLMKKYPNESPYDFCLNSPLAFKDADGRDAILIVFPDYKISTPVGKIGGLGHAGVLLIDNATGITKYYEYGRYDENGKGLVRTVTVPNVVIGKDGKPTVASLNKVLGEISKKSGQGGQIDGAYVISDKFKEMNDYAKEKKDENSDSDRKSYSLLSNNCGTFAADVINQDPCVDQPSLTNCAPSNIVEEYQEEGNAKVTYDPKAKSTTIGKGDETDAKDCPDE